MRPRSACPTRGCGAKMEHWQRLCGSCFARLPSDQRAAIRAARERKDVVAVSRLCGEAALWLAAHTPATEMARRLGENL